MQLRKARTNIKSNLVYKGKKHIPELYEFGQEGNISDINLRIDFLLEKNRYFCKYQEVDSFTPLK
jgi:hypothetical protein